MFRLRSAFCDEYCGHFPDGDSQPEVIVWRYSWLSQLIGDATNIWWGQARDVAVHSTMHGRFPTPPRQPHPTKNYSIPNIESEEVRKSRLRVMLLDYFVSEKKFPNCHCLWPRLHHVLSRLFQ